jgi:hypothetical protein
MAFISGPRQVGKTALSTLLKDFFDESFYYNWDQTESKKTFLKEPEKLLTSLKLENGFSTKLLILDEIHKAKGWKKILKGLYDLHHEEINFIITGSAKLNTYRKGGDSLLGRNFNFRFHPFTLGEYSFLDLEASGPQDFLKSVTVKPERASPTGPGPNLEENLLKLFKFSGFPEPLLKEDEKWHRLWKKGRKEKISKEEIRDFTNIHNLSMMEVLIELLPEKVSSPLSVSSLREDLDLSHDTISRWLKILQELYYFFAISPYHQSIPRSLKKDQKIYLFDWTEIEEEGPRFENLVACHLLKACHFWEDSGEGDFQLYYLRNKEKKEVDFFLTKDKKPFFTVECKLNKSNLDTSYQDFSPYIRHCPHFQLVMSPNIWRSFEDKAYVMSASSFLSKLA